MNKIIFKSYYFTKSLYWWGGISAIVSAFIFLNLNLLNEDKFQISVGFAAIGSFVVIYLNKFEPHYIEYSENEFTVFYLNKVIFKNKPKTFLKKDIQSSISKNVIIVYTGQEKVTNIRYKDLDPRDWEILKTYFTHT